MSPNDVPAIRQAGPADYRPVVELLSQAKLPTAGVPENLDGFVVAVQGDGSLAGLAGLERYGREGLLRSVVVAPALRGTGVGRALSEHMVGEARRRGLTDLYLLTTTAEAYFPRLGFTVIPRLEIPAGVQASVEFRGACPETAVAMHLALA
jgi:N-acetylglutamate synthase-like GNAT family acetyltransferase